MAKIEERVAVVGLGYVGLPVAVAFARVAPTLGYDIDPVRIAALRAGLDATGEVTATALGVSALTFADDPAALAGATLFVVTVPTPIDREKRPDFGPLLRACAEVGGALSPGALVVFESTVFPGATEEVLAPALEAASGLRAGRDFALGYSPERINPGDPTNRFETIARVVAADSPTARARLRRAYAAVVDAEIFEAASIRVAEAAKVIENTQRDVNIALMNELAMIFERLGLRTADVLAAARTKWNFLPFTPGLVGGHCIGVDPYYLTAKAEAVGHHPEVILSGRRINDEMGRFVAQKTLKLLVATGAEIGRARVGILGLAFKENVPDLRNSRTPDIVAELAQFGVDALVHDPYAAPDRAVDEHGIRVAPLSAFRALDALILAVRHRSYLADPAALVAMLRPGGVLVDVKSALDPGTLPEHLTYWSL
ncbi:MAG: nucleotide sugar dehydrogenase [Paracoccaceae bacterium]